MAEEPPEEPPAPTPQSTTSMYEEEVVDDDSLVEEVVDDDDAEVAVQLVAGILFFLLGEVMMLVCFISVWEVHTVFSRHERASLSQVKMTDTKEGDAADATSAAKA